VGRNERLKQRVFYATFEDFFFLANFCQSVAVLMTCRHMSLSLAFLQAV